MGRWVKDKMFIKKLLFLLIFSSILGNIESAYNCPGYPWIDATNMASPNVNLGCIRFYGTQKMTWIEAENFCRSQNAHLIEILNSEQQSFLAGHANQILEDTAMFNSGNWWIGLTRYSDGLWYWSYSYKLAEYTSWVQHPYIPYPGNGTFAFLGWPPKGPYPDPFDWEDCSNDCALYPICQMDL